MVNRNQSEATAATGIPAVFLDRDGVINENRPDHVKSEEEAVVFPFAAESVSRLIQAGFKVVVVTNQSVVGRGGITSATAWRVNDHIVAQIDSEGQVAALMCEHHPDEDCLCRKPRPGMLLDASAAFGIDLSKSYMVGDAVTDMQAGHAAGTKASILVRTGRGKAQEEKLAEYAEALPDVKVVESLAEAVDWILETEGRNV